mgnify:CR=1 FL=1
MALVIELGNSRTKMARFPAEAPPTVVTLKSPPELEKWAGEQIVFLDTRSDPVWRAALARLGAQELRTAQGLPFRTAYSTRLGPDRAAQLVAAWQAKSFPALVISLGTACVLDYLDKDGVHRGGIIAPGLHLRLWALHHRTGRLPLVAPIENPPLLGQDTPEALQSAALYGLAWELQGWIRQLNPQTLWLTGGEAEKIRPYLPSGSIFAPDLTLTGAWLWWQFLQGRRLACL